MASSKSRNNRNLAISGSWKDWCMEIYDRVAANGCVASCMPLPTDGVVPKEIEQKSVTTLEYSPRTIITTTTTTTTTTKTIHIPMLRNKSEAEKASPPQSVTQVAKRRVSTLSGGDDHSSKTFENPFPQSPKPNDAIAAVPRDTRSFDSSVRPLVYTSASNIDNNVERELPPFGTHRSRSSNGHDSSFGTSSYSQANFPALCTYMYRCHERTLQDPNKTHCSFERSLEEPPTVLVFYDGTSSELFSEYHGCDDIYWKSSDPILLG